MVIFIPTEIGRKEIWSKLKIQKMENFILPKLEISIKKGNFLDPARIKNQKMTRINFKSGTILSHFCKFRRSDWFRLDI